MTILDKLVTAAELIKEVKSSYDIRDIQEFLNEQSGSDCTSLVNAVEFSLNELTAAIDILDPLLYITRYFRPSD